MQYDIYTFGNGEILKGVFDSIAACLNGHSGTLFEPLKRLGLILGVFWGVLYAAYGDFMKPLTHWILPSTMFMTILFVPQASIWIHDPVTKYHQKVDHVPYGLAAFAGYISKIGNGITEQVEKVFTLPDDLRYQKSGSLFASNIIQQAKTFHITNHDIAENMRGFVGQCIMYDAMIGRKYTIDDLRNSDDIWGLVSESPSPIRSFLWREPKTDASRSPATRPEIITCREGVARFNRLWGQEIDKSANLFGQKIFGKNALINPKAELLKYLPIAYATLGDMAKSATDIIKQQMMIYSIVDSIEANSTAVGNAPNFAARRAYLQQRSTYETLGEMAGTTLPTMKAVLEAIAYACFLFVIPMALLPMGYRFLLSWAQILLWLQMWAPLYAVLNYIMTMAARSKTLSALAVSNEAGVTIANSIGITNMNADISAMAGYLAMSVPFLCVALVKGVGSFVHMASHLGGVSQSAAGMAASEVTSGNFSFGNISEGNSQISNSNMLQHSNGASYKAHSFQMMDGRSEITTMSDGSQVSNYATSNLPVSVNLAQARSNQLSQMSSESYQNGLNLSEASSSNLSSASRSMVSLSDTLSKLESSGDTANLGISSEQSQAIHHGKQLINDFAKTNQIDTEKSAQLLGSVGVGNGKGLGLISGSATANGQIGAKEQELYNKAQRFAEDHNYQDALRHASQASKQLSHNLSDESARRLAEDVSGSYEKGMSQRTEASKSFSQSEQYSRQAMDTLSNSATINFNASQQMVEWIAEQPADNTGGGKIGMREATRIVSTNPEVAQNYGERFLASQGLNPRVSVANSASSVRGHYDNEQSHQIYAVTKDSMNEVRTSASNMSGFDRGAQAREKTEAQLSSQQGEIHQGSSGIQTHGSHLKSEVHQEQDKGVIRRVGAKGIGEISNIGKGVIDDLKNLRSGEAQQK